METPSDFKDLLALFNAHNVEFVIVNKGDLNLLEMDRADLEALGRA